MSYDVHAPLSLDAIFAFMRWDGTGENPMLPELPSPQPREFTMDMLTAKTFTVDEMLSVLCASGITKGGGEMWTADDVKRWMRIHRLRNYVVSRALLYEKFPDAFKRLRQPELAVDKSELALAMSCSNNGKTSLGPVLRLYAVEIVGVCVKIGISSSVQQRLRTHFAAAAVHDREVDRVWVSAVHKKADAIEQAFKDAHGGHEYVRGCLFDEVVGELRDAVGAGDGISGTAREWAMFVEAIRRHDASHARQLRAALRKIGVSFG